MGVTPATWQEVRVQDCEFSVKTCNLIRRHFSADFRLFLASPALGQVAALTPDELLKVPGLGAKGRREIEEILTNVRSIFAAQVTPAQATPVVSGWRTMGTAPTDGTPVLVWAAPCHGLPGFVTCTSYHRKYGWCVDELREVTMWQPLPAPPTTENPDAASH